MKLNRTMIALGATMAIAAFGTAGAATSGMQSATQATCDALVKQADNALSAHKSDSKAKSAQEARDSGEKECKAGNYAKGADHLRHAITDLGMKPVS